MCKRWMPRNIYYYYDDDLYYSQCDAKPKQARGLGRVSVPDKRPGYQAPNPAKAYDAQQYGQ